MTKLPWWRADASELVAVTAMGVWEAVLAGGGRRFIKRKDSDAGETGSHPHHPVLILNIFFKKKDLSAGSVGVDGERRALPLALRGWCSWRGCQFGFPFLLFSAFEEIF